MKHQIKAYPLRLEDEVRAEAEKLAAVQDRSLNWQLNELVKIGLASFASGKEKTLIAAGKH